MQEYVLDNAFNVMVVHKSRSLSLSFKVEEDIYTQMREDAV
jgi:hypothetical protein